jgi:hypothetical protein
MQSLTFIPPAAYALYLISRESHDERARSEEGKVCWSPCRRGKLIIYIIICFSLVFIWESILSNFPEYSTVVNISFTSISLIMFTSLYFSLSVLYLLTPIILGLILVYGRDQVSSVSLLVISLLLTSSSL